MKRIFSMVLALILTCNIAIPTVSADFQIGASSDVIEAGQQVTIEVTLDETLTHENNFRNCQGELYYDSDILTYVSHTMGAGYEDFDSAHISNRGRVQFSKTAMSSSGYESIPAGTVVTVVFQVKETMTEDFLTSTFELKMSVMPVGQDAIKTTDSFSIEICREPIYIDAGQQLTVAVALNEELTHENNLRNFQGELYYDSEMLTYVSHAMGSGYEDFDNAHIINQKRVQFSKTAVSSNGYESIPAGTVVTVVFCAKEAMTESQLRALFELKMSVMPVGMDAVAITDAVSVRLAIVAVLMGDVTGDGKINVGDAVKLLKAIASKTTDEFSDNVFKAADVTRDGKINVGDAVKLLKAIASKTTDEL